jgi:hypothetical protein
VTAARATRAALANAEIQEHARLARDDPPEGAQPVHLDFKAFRARRP